MIFGLKRLHTIFEDLDIDFMKQKYWAFALSIFVTIASLFGLAFRGLNLGIDFAGGILLEFSYVIKEGSVSQGFNQKGLRVALDELGYHYDLQEQKINENRYNLVIRAQPKKSAEPVDEVKILKDMVLKSSVTNNINEAEVEFTRVDYVGPKVGSEFISNAVQAVIAALLVMMLYTMIRFRWQFSLGVLIALLHDAIATIGFYVLSGYLFDLTSIAAILTVIGYSINDSVVIYDRIRENIEGRGGKTIARRYKDREGSSNIVGIINRSINETLSRTTMTVATTLVVCIALLIFGGETLRGFSAAICFGIAFGTYSSIYISAPILSLFWPRTREERGLKPGA